MRTGSRKEGNSDSLFSELDFCYQIRASQNEEIFYRRINDEIPHVS